MIAIVPPGVLVGLTLSALYAGLFHVWRGRSLRDLVVFLIVSAAGFAIGQMIGVLLQLPFPHIGQVYFIEGTFFSWLAMIGVRELRYGQPGHEVDSL